MPDAARLVDGGDVGHFESIEADSIVSWIDFTLGIRTHSSYWSYQLCQSNKTQLKHASVDETNG